MFVIVLNQTNVIDDGQNNKLIYRFPNSITFKNKYIAVSSVSMYYSWFNITTAYRNNTITFIWDSVIGTVYTITIPDGLYQISDINNFIQFECIRLGTYWQIAGVNYYPFELQVNPNRYAIQLNTFLVPSVAPAGTTIVPSVGWPGTQQNPIVSFPANFYNIVGYQPIAGVVFTSNNNFNNLYIPPTPSTANDYFVAKDGAGTLSYLSNAYPNVQPNSSCLISISNIVNPYAIPASIIYSINPTVNIGELIVDRPPNFMWNRMIDGTYNELRISLLGNDLAPLLLKDPSMTILLTIRDGDEAYLGSK